MLSSMKSWWGASAASPEAAGASKSRTDSPVAEADQPANEPQQPAVEDVSAQQQHPDDQEPNLSTKEAAKEVLHAAKDWGAYIYTFSKRATTTVASKAKKLATAPNIVEDFDRQQKDFVAAQTERRSRAEAAVPPWVGYDNEEQLREQILALSKDTRNFLRSPPQGASFAFDMEANSPVAMATLEVDENLRKMRFDLVPKRVREEEFWRNYFYRVSLIRQSSQLSALARSNSSTSTGAAASAAAAAAAAADSASTSSDAGYEKISPPPSQQLQATRSSPAASSGNSPASAIVDAGDDADCGEFASSELANQLPAALSSVERRRIGGGADAEEWEEELQRELKEFELVNTAGGGGSGARPQAAAGVDEELEREILEQLAVEN